MVKMWDASSGECLHTFRDQTNLFIAVAFSPNSKWLAASAGDSTTKIWDVESGACLHALKSRSTNAPSVAFSHDSAWLASASFSGTVDIWDTSSGACVHTLNVGRSLERISFDTKRSCLHTDIGTIPINDVLAVQKSGAKEDLTYDIRGASISQDGVWITYDDEDALWLPSDYRPSCYDVSGENIIIGLGSGRVWICNIRGKPSDIKSRLKSANE
jgi:WD40 repeat protein